jgi:enoyl-[acyl-carrier protein] reductase I
MDTSQAGSGVLAGRRALIVAVANEHSIAWGCAKAFRELGADVALTDFSERARPHVEPLARQIGAAIFKPLDVEQPGQLEAVVDRIARDWGRMDIAVHSVARAPRGRSTRRPAGVLGSRLHARDGGAHSSD